MDFGYLCRDGATLTSYLAGILNGRTGARFRIMCLYWCNLIPECHWDATDISVTSQLPAVSAVSGSSFPRCNGCHAVKIPGQCWGYQNEGPAVWKISFEAWSTGNTVWHCHPKSPRRNCERFARFFESSSCFSPWKVGPVLDCHVFVAASVRWIHQIQWMEWYHVWKGLIIKHHMESRNCYEMLKRQEFPQLCCYGRIWCPGFCKASNSARRTTWSVNVKLLQPQLPPPKAETSLRASNLNASNRFFVLPGRRHFFWDWYVLCRQLAGKIGKHLQGFPLHKCDQVIPGRVI